MSVTSNQITGLHSKVASNLRRTVDLIIAPLRVGRKDVLHEMYTCHLISDMSHYKRVGVYEF